MKATHINIENLTLRQRANRALKAMTALQDSDNGTIRNPYELASSRLKDGRTLIEAIYSGEDVSYNDGWCVVEVNDTFLYVDLTMAAMRDMGMSEISFVLDDTTRELYN